MKLYLVRHGNSAGNLPGRMTGWSDHSLTSLGVAQAQRVAARLAPLGPMPVFASDLPRALETARLITAQWGPVETATAATSGAAPTADRRLREIGLGDYEGKSWDEFVADTDLADAFAREPLLTALPGGESLAAVRERVLAAFHEIAAREHEAVCLVSHDGPIRTLLNHLLGVPAKRHWVISTTHGGLSLVETSPEWTNVRFVNDTSHLAGLPSSDDGPAAGVAAATEAVAAKAAGASEAATVANEAATGAPPKV
jgi:broad specificity phosphatase PhoE